MALPNEVNVGTAPNNGTGDPLRTGGQKINANFVYLENNKIGLVEKGANNGVATLDSTGKLTSSQLPALAITDVIIATENTIAAFAANSGNYTFQQGDVIIIDDGSGNLTHYLYAGGVKTDVNEYSEINGSEVDISQVNGLQDALDAKANDSEVIKGIRDSEGNLIAPNAQREVTLPDFQDQTPLASVKSYPNTKQDESYKAIFRLHSGAVYVFSGTGKKNYKLYILKNYITTPTQSLASSSSDITSYRVTDVLHVSDIVVGNVSNPILDGGGILDRSLTVNIEPYTSGQPYQYKRIPIGSYIEYEVEVDINGKIDLTFMKFSNPEPSVEVAVDGVVIDEINLNASSVYLKKYEYDVEPGLRNIRITNISTTDYVEFIGFYFSFLNELKSSNVDTIGYYRNSTLYSEYLNVNSANDYAYFDLDANLWGGSYHGGETGINTLFADENGEVDVSVVGELNIAKKFEVHQSFNIDWTSFGGGLMNLKTIHSFSFAEGYNLEVSTKGTIRASTYYTCLFGVNEIFNNLTIPSNIDISTYTDGEYVLLGRTNKVKYQKDETLQFIEIAHTEYDSIDNFFGGANVRVTAGSYNKYYYGPLQGQAEGRTIGNTATINVFTFL